MDKFEFRDDVENIQEWAYKCMDKVHEIIRKTGLKEAHEAGHILENIGSTIDDIINCITE